MLQKNEWKNELERESNEYSSRYFGFVIDGRYTGQIGSFEYFIFDGTTPFYNQKTVKNA